MSVDDIKRYFTKIFRVYIENNDNNVDKCFKNFIQYLEEHKIYLKDFVGTGSNGMTFKYTSKNKE